MNDDAIPTDAELAKWTALCEAEDLHPGPWHTWADAGGDENDIVGPTEPLGYGHEGYFRIFDEGAHSPADARFIAAARTAMPRLIAALRAERGEVERLRARDAELDRPYSFIVDGHCAHCGAEAEGATPS